MTCESLAPALLEQMVVRCTLTARTWPERRRRMFGSGFSQECRFLGRTWLVNSIIVYQVTGSMRPVPTIQGAKGVQFAQSGAQAAYRVTQSEILYEWELPVLGDDGKTELDLEEGMRIGFDIGIADKDALADSSAWLTWAPTGALKFLDASLLGDVVLINDYDSVGQVTLLAMDKSHATPVPNLVFEWYEESQFVRRTVTNREGQSRCYGAAW